MFKKLGKKKAILYFKDEDYKIRDRSTLDLIELEIRELIENYGFSQDTPVIRGSAKRALEGDVEFANSIKELMSNVDSFIKKCS